MMRAVDLLITFMMKVCRPVSRRLSVIEQGDLLVSSLFTNLKRQRKFASQLRK